MQRSKEVIADRFAIEQLAGFGGMGQVYRARDRRSGALVALKVMHDADHLEISRFAREAQVLASLSHPGIVRYIDSGFTTEGEPYLVMEWLSGETLSARLARTQLTLSEVFTLGRRVASALGAIHGNGVVHRDIKPNNLFLQGGALDKVVLVDFGMARRPLADPRLTVTGTMLGTPGYIAPEQVYNVPNLDGRADIFSLGCVLYRCLSGRPPFRGPDALRMLLNGTSDQLPRLREFRPSIPPELDELVARMLSRSPDDRPSSADKVASALQAIEEREPASPSSRPGPHSVLSELSCVERRLMCLVMARRLGEPDPLPGAARAGAAMDLALREVIERHRGKLEVLADGCLLVILSNGDAAPDLAVRAARCATSVQRVLGHSAVVVVSGREVLGPGLADGELIDRARELLETTEKWATVRIDELTAGLLRGRFDTGRTGRHLRGELRDLERRHLGLGDPEPCVGREQELDHLETIFTQCAEEHVASMVLVSGAEGVGKSCLGREFLRRLEARGQPVKIWRAEADPLGASSAFALLAQVLRRALGMSHADSVEVRRSKIRAWRARHPIGASGVAEVVGELVDTPIDSEHDGERGLPPQAQRLQSEQIRQAFLGVLRAECAAQPVVIVLEDLHWGDSPTIKLIYAALGALPDRRLMVLALARNKVHEIFPQLWADRCVQEIQLRKLSRRASAQLVRRVLGDAVDDAALKALVERSDRNASYLAELIRAAENGNSALTPPTVLAMVQARIEKLDPAARRVLRAASVFGETFWRGGVEALLGGGDTAAWLAVLVEQGVIQVMENGRFPAEVEYRFHHSLVREAAYEMLTQDDRMAGHWLAGRWLEHAGETDAAMIEAHFEHCGGGGGRAEA
ncbi:MAG TPA: protein kinase [Kofleriaceae bacterium]|nr:protein kinase [Kofleriaceae bacterium]